MSSPFEVEPEWWGPGTVPAPASIVWCNFPDHLAPNVPGPKSRPALVFKARYADDPPEDRFLVLVAYGTSKLKTGKRPNDFSISNAATLDIVRLPAATRFDLDKFVWVPWARPFFCPRRLDDPFSTPVISVLPESVAQSLKWTMARREQKGLNAAYHGARTIDMATDEPQLSPAPPPTTEHER